MSERRVAVTGIGLLCALGLSREEVWRRMLAAECGMRRVTVFDPTGYRSEIAGEMDLEPAAATFTRLERRRWSRSDQLGVMAASEAVADAGLLDASLDPTRVGVLLGAGTADLLRNEEYYFTMVRDGIARARPSKAWNHFSSTPVDVIAARFGLEGMRSCIAAACSSSTIAIGHAAEAIRRGRLDAALAGGTDALARLTFSGFNALRLMDPGPCRPFDRGRNGMNIGEGAAILVLEDMARARRRGASIYAELAGYSLSCEAYHPTAPEPEGRAVAAMVSAALDAARVLPDEVDHVNAHGTATPQNDRAEASGFLAVFRSRARALPVTSIKSMVGHCLGSAGAVEAAVLALTVARGTIPPTIHHEATDPDCPIEVVANEARQHRVRCGVSTSLAFGGNDAALVMRSV
ncbi:MAG: beta-ketoacyl-[acyl-carrier-protein] synthase II [Luteitalea sp.]|nr:beta-ketoacyl-[acyl-carrier-protein] synthase II [Luteitalea sp.]